MAKKTAPETIQENIIKTEYSDVMQKSYIDYAMSVIIARALPDIRDGLKPVQRRTLYDMYGFQSTYFILGCIAFVFTLISLFTLVNTRKISN